MSSRKISPDRGNSVPEMCRAIRAARIAKGLTQVELAKGAGLAWRTIARIEAGAVPKQITLVRLDEVLGTRLRRPPEVRERTPGAALRELRLKAGYTVPGLASLTDLSPFQITRAERGKNVPRGGWDAFLDDNYYARALGFRDEQELIYFVTSWIEDD